MQTKLTGSIPGRAPIVLAAGALVAILPLLAAAAEVRVETARDDAVGEYLTDSRGMTLYLFEKDERGPSTCYDACTGAWPPLVTGGEVNAGPGVDADKLSTIEREDGSEQVTYNGWPLYYFRNDDAPGDAHGQDVEGFGGEWYMVSPAGSKADSEEHEEDEAHDENSGYGGEY